MLKVVGRVAIERLMSTTSQGSVGDNAPPRARPATAHAARVTALIVCVHCAHGGPGTMHYVVHCFRVTTHGLCSRTLFMDTVKIK